MELWVRRKPGGLPHQGILGSGDNVYPCSLGRSGITARKREGDGATPAGRFRLLYGFYRHERLGVINSSLPLNILTEQMGWCDGPQDPCYNSLVQLPFNGSHEIMKRDDRLYDVCIVLDYNIMPRARGKGSAIFFHLTRPDNGPTEGCVAIDPLLMQKFLPVLSDKSIMTVLLE